MDWIFRFRVQKANFAFLFSGGLKKKSNPLVNFPLLTKSVTWGTVCGMIVVKDLEYKKPYEGPSTCKKTSMSELKLFIASGADEIQIQKIVHKDKKEL